MALNLRKTRDNTEPHRILLYGIGGIGKSTFGAQLPHSIFVDAESGLGELDAVAFEAATSLDGCWDPLYEILYADEVPGEWLVVDTIDWVVQYMDQYLSKKKGVETIKDIGWGKGGAYLFQLFSRYLGTLSQIADKRRMNILLLAHSAITKFSPPGLESYDVYSPKVPDQVGEMLKEWAKCVWFAGRLEFVKKVEESFGKDRFVPVGGDDRVLYTSIRPEAYAKSRIEIPPVLKFDAATVLPYLQRGRMS